MKTIGQKHWKILKILKNISKNIETCWEKIAKRWNTFLQENDQHMVDFLYIYVGFPDGEFLGEG
jgi:hypothetical protein